jgi:hypothetical protein
MASEGEEIPPPPPRGGDQQQQDEKKAKAPEEATATKEENDGGDGAKADAGRYVSRVCGVSVFCLLPSKRANCQPPSSHNRHFYLRPVEGKGLKPVLLREVRARIFV